jgi:hypothetical protein
MTSVLARIIDITSEQTGIPVEKLTAGSAIDQDLRISGGDVLELAAAFAAEFGENVLSWPWDRFAQLDEGLPLSFPFVLLKQLLTWPFRSSFEYPTPYERLELGHIAVVLERGQWFEP